MIEIRRGKTGGIWNLESGRRQVESASGYANQFLINPCRVHVPIANRCPFTSLQFYHAYVRYFFLTESAI